jgi:hypothetical protein
MAGNGVSKVMSRRLPPPAAGEDAAGVPSGATAAA